MSQDQFPPAAGAGGFVDHTTALVPAAARLSDGSVFIDPRSIRALTSADQVTIANASLAVTGSFFQATQPVSLATAPTTPVTGTFWQATQPVSLATAPTTPITAAALPLPAGAATDRATAAAPAAVRISTGAAFVDPTAIRALTSTDVVSVTAALGSPLSVQPVVSGAAVDPRAVRALTATDVVTIVPPTVTKGTQGATGVTTQDLKDAGRVAITITTYALAGTITTETLTSLVRQADGVAAGAATSFTVTALKRLRLQQFTVTMRTTAAAAANSKVALRYVPSGGTLANTSPIAAVFDLQTTAAVAQSSVTQFMNFPDGFELPAGAIYGIYNLSNAATNLLTVVLSGFEY